MKSKKTILLAIFLLANACGGSGSDRGDNKIIEGLLTQGQADEHSKNFFKHGTNEPLEEVKICAFGRCSSTDGQGNFGFSAPDDFNGGAVLFSVDGHGILAETTLTIPETGKDVYLHLESNNNSEVHLKEMIVDGVAVSSPTEP